MNKDKEIIQALDKLKNDSEQIAQWAEQQKEVLNKLPEASEAFLKQQQAVQENMGQIAGTIQSQLDAIWKGFSKL
ncbi:TPA: hypothetical protein NJ909_003342 [Vibrio parahaemolyticus]|nr:hypothetical protein [Vibrio parahaemolyticus]